MGTVGKTERAERRQGKGKPAQENTSALVAETVSVRQKT